MKICVLILFMSMTSVAWPQQPARNSAADLLHDALTAMGGEQRIRDLKAIHFTAVGHRNLLEQSERPEGPYIVDYAHIDEWRDLEHGRWKQETKTQNVLEESVRTVIVSDGAAVQKLGTREMPASGEELQGCGGCSDVVARESPSKGAGKSGLEEIARPQFAKRSTQPGFLHTE